MKRTVLLYSCLAVLVGLVAAWSTPTRAETAFSFSISDGGRHDRHYDRHRGRHYPHYSSLHHHRHWPRHRAFYYSAPPIVYAPPPVIYPAVRYIPASSLLAEPVSPSYINSYGQQCREYQTNGWIGGSLEQTYGTACLQPDGAWRVVD